MATSEITLTIDNSYPMYKSALTDEAGGSWTAGTYSLIVVAWFTASETDNDTAGLERAVSPLADWEITLASDNRKINIDWKASDRIPNHYCVYYQAGSGMNLDAFVYKCMTADGYEIDKHTTSVTLLHPNISRGSATSNDIGGINLTDVTDGTFETDKVVKTIMQVKNVTDGGNAVAIDSITSETVLVNSQLTGGTDNDWDIGDAYIIQYRETFGADATSMTLDLLSKFLPRIRRFTAIGYNAKPVKRSNASNSIVSGLDITIHPTTCSQSEYKTILTWMGLSLDVKIDDGDTNALIQTYYGRFVDTNYLGSWDKGGLETYDLEFLVESTSA